METGIGSVLLEEPGCQGFMEDVSLTLSLGGCIPATQAEGLPRDPVRTVSAAEMEGSVRN